MLLLLPCDKNGETKAKTFADFKERLMTPVLLIHNPPEVIVKRTVAKKLPPSPAKKTTATSQAMEEADYDLLSSEWELSTLRSPPLPSP